jgi:hypothetical protein
MIAEPYRLPLASVFESASKVLAASSASRAKTEFGLWPPPRRWLL